MRFITAIATAAALMFLATAPTDLEARCGSASGRRGLFARFRERRSAAPVFQARTTYGYAFSSSGAYQAAPPPPIFLPPPARSDCPRCPTF